MRGWAKEYNYNYKIMWIRKLPDNYKKEESGLYKLNFLWNHNNIYVMDNHLAAAYCWVQKCNGNRMYNFLHIDQHNDLLCNAPICEYAEILKEKTCSIDNYCSKMYKNNLPLMRWDNYIKPTQILHPDWFKINVFSTHSNYEDTIIQDIEPPMKITRIEPSKLPRELDLIFKNYKEKWIVTLDLDFFFDENANILFDDEYLIDFANKLRQYMDKIQVLTISLSPECCGNGTQEGWKNSIRVLDVFMQTFGILQTEYVHFPIGYN